MSKVGRKAGVRSKNYDEAIKDFMLNRGSISEIAKRYKIDRSGLHKAINSIKNSTANNELQGKDLKELVAETKAGILNGVSNLETLKKSTSPLHNEIADEIMEELRMSNLKTAKFIHALGQRLLKDLLETTNELRENNQLNLQNLNMSLRTLETANNFLGLPKNPIIAVQNNIQNNQLNTQSNLKVDTKSDFNININFVKAKNKNDDEIIDIQEEDENNESV